MSAINCFYKLTEMFMKHIKVTLKKLNNWCPTKDYGETWD